MDNYFSQFAARLPTDPNRQRNLQLQYLSPETRPDTCSAIIHWSDRPRSSPGPSDRIEFGASLKRRICIRKSGRSVESSEQSVWPHCPIRPYLLRYGQPKPPVYDTSSIRNVPIGFFVSQNDWFADAQDVEAVRKTLSTLKTFYTVSGNQHGIVVPYVYSMRRLSTKVRWILSNDKRWLYRPRFPTRSSPIWTS